MVVEREPRGHEKCITGTAWNKEEEVESEKLIAKESCIS